MLAHFARSSSALVVGSRAWASSAWEVEAEDNPALELVFWRFEGRVSCWGMFVGSMGGDDGDFIADEGFCGRLGLGGNLTVEEGPESSTSNASSLLFFKTLFFFRPMIEMQ